MRSADFYLHEDELQEEEHWRGACGTCAAVLLRATKQGPGPPVQVHSTGMYIVRVALHSSCTGCTLACCLSVRARARITRRLNERLRHICINSPNNNKSLSALRHVTYNTRRTSAMYYVHVYDVHRSSTFSTRVYLCMLYTLYTRTMHYLCTCTMYLYKVAARVRLELATVELYACMYI